MDYLPQSTRVGNPIVEVTLFVAVVVPWFVFKPRNMMKKKMESFLSAKLFIMLSADLAERPPTD